MTKKSTTKRGGSSPSVPRERPIATKGKARVVAEEAPQKPTAEHGEGYDGALRALALALDKKALQPILLDVRNLCSFCNYQLVVSGRSERQVDAIADGINSGLKADGLRPLGAEAARTGQWALLDYGDFVVHVFLDSAREHYDLEGLWNDAPRVTLDVPADALLHAGDPYVEAPR
ncbi:MAG: ribosome silencing factor [Deltaproteobacteria bacterium]|nr:ribosome silencing factor [Deltaproteobacteria bacterium]MCW5802289.1 ribosome silencing factor [Deltaproteobacteria bacterium]